MPEQPPSLAYEELDMKARVLRICVEKLMEQSLERAAYRPAELSSPRVWPRPRLPRGVCAICGSGDTPGHICIR